MGSILSYSAETWGHHEAPEIEKVHTKFLRNILGVRKSTNISALYGELGRFPMKIARKIKLIKYWTKLLTNRDTLEFKVYCMLKYDCDNGNDYKGTWTRLMWFFRHLGKPVTDRYSLWGYSFKDFRPVQTIVEAQIINSNRLVTYSNIKFDFGLETYLQVIQSFKIRRALTRFRISSHSLAIETGRHHNKERSNRKCIYCNMNIIESEFHFMLICPLYADLRSKYLNRYYCRWPTVHKFHK